MLRGCGASILTVGGNYRTPGKTLLIDSTLPGTNFRADFLKNETWAHTIEMATLEISRGDLTINASLGVCTLPIWRENQLRKSTEGV